MQVSINRSQLITLLNLGLINKEKFKTCKVEFFDGDFTDSAGNKVKRVNIYVPAATDAELVSGSDILNSIKGSAAATAEKPESHNTDASALDDLEQEMGA